MKITPTIKPEYKQHLAYEKLFDKVTHYVGFGGGAGGGKSWLGAEWIITMCYMYPGTKWFIGRNKLTNLMGSSFATFMKVCEFHDIPRSDWKLNGQYHYIQFKNGSRIDLLDLKLTPSDPQFQDLGSTEYTSGWIEEAGEISFQAFDMLKTRVGRWKNKEYGLFPAKILLTMNPEQNWLYRIFYKPWKKGTLGTDYAFIQSLYGDNSYTRDEYEEQLSKISDPIMKARLKVGNWEYMASDNALCTYDAINDLFTNVLEKSNEKYLSADVARYGSDKTVIGTWKGLEVNKIIWKVKRGVDQTTTDIRDLLRGDAIPYSHAIADDDGVGGGVVDNLRGIKGFVANSSPIKTEREEDEKLPTQNYRNLKSQCGFILAEKINNHEISITAPIDDATKEEIIEELMQLKRKITTTEQKHTLVPKDEVKEALGRSPDFSDMLMMRMYFELKEVEDFVQPTDVGGMNPYIPGTLA